MLACFDKFQADKEAMIKDEEGNEEDEEDEEEVDDIEAALAEEFLVIYFLYSMTDVCK